MLTVAEMSLPLALPGPHSLPAELCQSRALARVLPLALHREAAAAPRRGPAGPGGVAGSLSLLIRLLASVAWHMSRSETSAQIHTPAQCPQKHFG